MAHHTSSHMNGRAWKEQAERIAEEEHHITSEVPQVREVRRVFARIDEDNDEVLDRTEIKKLMCELGIQTNAASFTEIMSAMDPDGDGTVSLYEFLAWWQKSGPQFKRRMAVLAAKMTEECKAEDAAAVLTQRHYRGYRTRRDLMVSELGVHNFHMPPYTRCIHLFQLASFLGSPPDARSAAAIESMGQLLGRLESGQPAEKRFFAQLESGTRKVLLSRCRIATYKAAEYVCEQGERSNDTFYFVVCGKVGVIIDRAKKFEMLSGATFGEKALSQESDVGLRTAGILAVTDCIMVTLTRADYFRTTEGTLEANVIKVLRMYPDDRMDTHVALVKNLFCETEFFKNIHHDSICTQLSRSCRHVRVRKNELLFRKGDDADTFYIVVQGFVRVVIDGTVALNLGPGMTFGELGVTGVTPAERRRTATIIGGKVPGAKTTQIWGNSRSDAAMGPCDLAVLSRHDYLFYTQGTEDSIRQVLLLSPSLRTDEHLKLLMNLFADFRFFKHLSSLMRIQVCRNLEMELCPSGHTVFREGEPGDTFYLIIRGTVKGIVSATSTAGSKRRTFELRTGNTFGDLAVTGSTEEERARTATVRCKDDCFFAVLSRASYLKATGDLEKNAYAALRKTRTRRKEPELNLLRSFFSELSLFKELHFAMLQTACCSIMQLKTLNAGDVLFEQKEWSDGVFYALLRGRLQVYIDDDEVEHYLPVREFGTSEHALSADPDKGDDNYRLRCDRTVIAMAPRDDEQLHNRLRVAGFPRSWKSTHVFEIFQVFGKIDMVKICNHKGEAKDTNTSKVGSTQWAIIQFADEHVAKKASRDKMVVMLDEATGLPIERSSIDTADRRPLSEAISLTVVMEEDSCAGKGDTVVESSYAEHADSESDVVVATIARDDYIAKCHDVMQEVIGILGMKPRTRSVKQLQLLKTFFANTKAFTDLAHSNMIQRNLSRFLGVLELESNQELYRQSDRANRMYIVIQGRIRLCSTQGVPESKPDDLSYLRTAGQSLGEEAVQATANKYFHTAVADGPAIVALVYRDEYRRICATDDMQRTIDTFWALGIQESAPTMVGEDPVLDFDGYKQLYLRIGKIIATKERFSLSELHATMHKDWSNDLRDFGDKSTGVLTHWQYSESMYQLVDEWCGAVESTKLYGDLLRMMLEFATDATEQGVILKPLNSIQCHFQTLLNMRHEASKEVTQEQRDSKIGIADSAGGSSGFSKFVFAQSLGPSLSTSTRGPKLGDTQSAEAKREQYFRDMFDAIDVDGSGCLDRSEIAQLSINMGRELRKIELDAAMAAMDPSGDGTVDFDEFKLWFKSLLDGDALNRDLFEAADKDGSGVIDRNELRLIMKELGNPLSPQDLDEAMAEMDSDGSGEIDFVEFSTWWSKRSSTQILRANEQDPQTEYYKEMFLHADTGGEGSLDREELRVLMIELGREMADHELDTAMQIMDEDGGGTVDLPEFMKWFAWLIDGDTTVRKMFDSADADGSGMLDHEEVGAALKRLCTEMDGGELTDSQIQEAIKLMDVDGSGEVDFEEFSSWWNVYTFQQRFKPDDPIIAHHRSSFDEVAKERAARYGAAGNDDAMKEAMFEIMQGRGTIDVQGFLELCSTLGRTIYDHEQFQAIKEVTFASETNQEVSFEAFMNFLDDVKAKDQVIQDMFESADTEKFGVLLRDGVKRALEKYAQHQARRSFGTTPTLHASQSNASVDESQIASAMQSALVSPDTLNLYSSRLDSAMQVTVTDEQVDLALLHMYEYQRERYKVQRSKIYGPQASLVQPPLKGQVDFDAFRHWVTVQKSTDPALRETTRISQVEARKQNRKSSFFRAMVESETQSKDSVGLSIDVPPPRWDDETARSPTDTVRISQRDSQPVSVPANFEGVRHPTAVSNRQPATSTGIPQRDSCRRRRSGNRRKDHPSPIELQFGHRRPFSPSGSSAAWPPMLPARASTLGAKRTTARTSQAKRDDGRRPRTFDELLQLTTCKDELLEMTPGWTRFSDISISSGGAPSSVRGKFQPAELRPKSAEVLDSFYNSDAARLSRGSSAEAIWGAGPAGAIEKRVATKLLAGEMPQRLSHLTTTARKRVSGHWQHWSDARLGLIAPSKSMDVGAPTDGVSLPTKPAPWHERLSSSGRTSQLEPVPSFLDSTRGGREYPGLGTRLNALHATRKVDAAARGADGPGGRDLEFGIDSIPLVARASDLRSSALL